MRMQIPWGLILIFVSLFIFYYTSKKSGLIRDNRRDNLRNRRQELLDATLRKKNVDSKVDDKKGESS